MKKNKSYGSILFILLFSTQLFAQTDIDAIMMGEKNLCIGPVYGTSSWKNYWEGTFKRENLNFGTVSSQMMNLMGNYGLSKKINVLFSLPYIQTQASAGTLNSMKGVQDFSLWLKYLPYEKTIGQGNLSFYAISGFSTPLQNYVVDYLPLSIGLGTTNFSLRIMADYQINSWFITLSGTYIYRSNTKIDRNSYYTTEVHYTNEVQMPDVFQVNARTGLRTDRFIAELVLNNQNTMGGFDITKNNMPFPSNQMNATTIGFNAKYNIKNTNGLSLVGSANVTLLGRNVGQSSAYNAGVFYIIDFQKSKK